MLVNQRSMVVLLILLANKFYAVRPMEIRSVWVSCIL